MKKPATTPNTLLHLPFATRMNAPLLLRNTMLLSRSDKNIKQWSRALP